MIAMRYDISLSDSFNITTIRDRVSNTGHLMDGFEDLLFKAYLISEKSEGEQYNSYSPLYVWKDSGGMNKFIFEGYYDNILKDFEWQNIEIAVVSDLTTSSNFTKSKYVVEEILDIHPKNSLKDENLKATLKDNELAKLVVYNPDKWKKVNFTFYENKPVTSDRCYEILHISQ